MTDVGNLKINGYLVNFGYYFMLIDYVLFNFEPHLFCLILLYVSQHVIWLTQCANE